MLSCQIILFSTDQTNGIVGESVGGAVGGAVVGAVGGVVVLIGVIILVYERVSQVTLGLIL